MTPEDHRKQFSLSAFVSKNAYQRQCSMHLFSDPQTNVSRTKQPDRNSHASSPPSALSCTCISRSSLPVFIGCAIWIDGLVISSSSIAMSSDGRLVSKKDDTLASSYPVVSHDIRLETFVESHRMVALFVVLHMGAMGSANACFRFRKHHWHSSKLEAPCTLASVQVRIPTYSSGANTVLAMSFHSGIRHSYQG